MNAQSPQNPQSFRAFCNRSRVLLGSPFVAVLIGVAAVTASPVPTPAASLSYSVATSSTAGANGSILADGTAIGTWNMTNFTYQIVDVNTGTISLPLTFVVSPFAAGSLSGTYAPYNRPGVSLDMSYPPTSSSELQYGISLFSYSVAATINPAFISDYEIKGVTIFGKGPIRNIGPTIVTAGTAGNYNQAGTYPAGILSIAGFSGTATLTNPVVGTIGPNLTGANGLALTSAGSLGGYYSGTANGNGFDTADWTNATIQWLVSSDAGSTMSFTADYQGRSSAYESSAFAFNVVQPVPEPGTIVLLAAAAGTALVWRRRASRRG